MARAVNAGLKVEDLSLDPGYFAEYRLAELQHQLNGREVGFQAAWQRYSDLMERRRSE